MKSYLGENEVSISETPFSNYTSSDWALYFIAVYGGFDGSHHKDWVLDQVARCLNGETPKVSIAKWDDGITEYRISLNEEPSQSHLEWIDEITDNNPDSYEFGCPP